MSVKTGVTPITFKSATFNLIVYILHHDCSHFVYWANMHYAMHVSQKYWFIWFIPLWMFQHSFYVLCVFDLKVKKAAFSQQKNITNRMAFYVELIHHYHDKSWSHMYCRSPISTPFLFKSHNSNGVTASFLFLSTIL